MLLICPKRAQQTEEQAGRRGTGYFLLARTRRYWKTSGESKSVLAIRSSEPIDGRAAFRQGSTGLVFLVGAEKIAFFVGKTTGSGKKCTERRRTNCAVILRAALFEIDCGYGWIELKVRVSLGVWWGQSAEKIF